MLQAMLGESGTESPRVWRFAKFQSQRAIASCRAGSPLTTLEPLDATANVRNLRLQLGVRVLPQRHERLVVRRRAPRISPGFVQLAETPMREGAADAVGGREVAHGEPFPQKALVTRDRGIRLPGGVECARQVERHAGGAVARGMSVVVPVRRAKLRDRVQRPPLRQGDLAQ